MLPFGLFICFFEFRCKYYQLFLWQCGISPKEFTCSFLQSNSSKNSSKVTFMRLALMDAPQSALTGAALEKQKEVVKKGKAAVDKLLIEAKKYWSNLQTRRMNCSKTCAFDTIVTVNRFLEILHCS